MHPLTTPDNLSSTRTSRVNALALSLQTSNKRAASPCQFVGLRPVIVVQDEDEIESRKSRSHSAYRTDNDEDNSYSVQVFRRRMMRSKSTPPTPVSAHLELPFVSNLSLAGVSRKN